MAFLLGCASCLALTASSVLGETAARDLSGDWAVSWVRFGETNVERLRLQTSGDQFTGTLFGDVDATGSVAGNHVEFELMTNRTNLFGRLKGDLERDEITGGLTLQSNVFPCRLSRMPQPKSPVRHEFHPVKFFNHFSGAVEPVLRIAPGDTVHTETVDAGGFDKEGVARARGGNPLTGPFFIEGAVRGDTLAVHFNRIRLNRETAMSGSSIVPSALVPGYVPNKKAETEVDGSWHLDREGGVARLAKPSDRLKDFTVPLQPMLGCVGVAPSRKQSLHSGDLGRHGGNLDYNQLREGTTLYLPIFEAGALLYVGDGHAAQGDGELTGDALETSMDVEFTVDLIPAKSIGGVRIENDEYLMAVGVGNSLTDALQEATTQLSSWLESDYSLDSSEVAMVLGFSMRYDVAEVVDPHVNVVAKIKRGALAKLRK